MTVEISFQTLHLPPPFAYAYTLHLEDAKGALRVSFQHEYLHRDQITADEIAEEGFSEDDDFEWKGQLPHVWSDVLKQLLHKTKVTEDRPEDEFLDSYLFLEVKEDDGKKGYPENAPSWQYMLEELIQGIYEVSEKETPLYLHVQSAQDSQEIVIQASFAVRELQLTQNGNTQSQEWTLLSKILGILESMELPMDGKPKPQRKGFWLSFDDEVYYKLKNDQANGLLKAIRG